MAVGNYRTRNLTTDTWRTIKIIEQSFHQNRTEQIDGGKRQSAQMFCAPSNCFTKEAFNCLTASFGRRVFSASIE